MSRLAAGRIAWIAHVGTAAALLALCAASLHAQPGRQPQTKQKGRTAAKAKAPQNTKAAPTAPAATKNSATKNPATKNPAGTTPVPAPAPPKTTAAPAGSSTAAIRQFRDASLFQNRGDYEFAIDEWQRFFELHAGDPLEPSARHYAGVCYLQLKRLDEARSMFETVIDKFPKLDVLDETYLNLGLTYYSIAQGGDQASYAKAAETLSALREKFPESPQLPQALLYLGEALYGQGKPADAVSVWTELVEKHPQAPNLPDALYALGVTQEELGEFAAASATYDRLLKEFPQSPNADEVNMRKGETLFAEKDFAGAAAKFAEAAAKPDFALADHATLRWGAALYEQKKYAEAAEVYTSLSAKFPDSKYAEPATLAAGSTYFLAGKYPEARRSLEKLLQSSGPSSHEAAHWIARSYLKESQPAEALRVVRSVLPGASGSNFQVELLMDQADALYELSDQRGAAVKQFADIAKRFPDDALAPQAAYMAAFASLKSGDYQGALEHVQSFLSAYSQHELATDVRYVAAESNLLLKNYADAAKLYEELLRTGAQHPDAPQWHLRHALALQLLGEHARVAELLAAAAPKLQTPELRAEAHYLQGNSLLELNNAQAAVDAYQQSLAAEPKFRQADEVLLNLSRAYRSVEDLKAAIDTVSRLINDYPQSSVADRAHFRLAEYAYASKDYDTAMREYQTVLDRWPSGALAPHAVYGLAWTELSRGRVDQAEPLFSQLIKQYPKHNLAVRAQYARASARQQQQNYEGALADLDAFLAASPTDAERLDALYLQGLCLVGLNRLEAAIETLRSILESDEQYGAKDKVLYELGWAYKSSGNEQGAAGAFGALAEQLPNSNLAGEAFFHVGEHKYHQEKDYAGAAEAYAKSQERSGSSEVAEKAMHKRAWALYQQKDYPAAQKLFRAQLDKFPSSPLAADAQLMLGESLLNQSQPGEALTAYEQALGGKLTSENFKALALLHAGQAAGKLNRWKQSADLLRQLLEEQPQSDYRYEAMYELGTAYQNLDQLAEAARQFSAVADESNSEIGARARFMLGEIYFLQKNHKEAIRNFFKVAYGYGHPNSPDPLKVWQAAATYEAGRCFEVLQSVDRAKAMYRELLEGYPDSDKAALAKERLQALGG